MIRDAAQTMTIYKEWLNTDHNGVYSGTPLDSIARLQHGDLVVIVASAKAGKSTFIHWYVANLTKFAHWHIAIVDFEGEEGEIINQVKAVTSEKHALQHIHLISEVYNVDSVCYDIEEAKRLYNIDCVVIDPYTNIMPPTADPNALNADLSKLQATAKRLGVAIIMMCHPTKAVAMATAKEEDTLSIYSVQGGGAFAQRCDIGLTLKTNYDTRTTTITANMIRHHQRGAMGESIVLDFHPDTFNYTLSTTTAETETALDSVFGSYMNNNTEATPKGNTLDCVAGKGYTIATTTLTPILTPIIEDEVKVNLQRLKTTQVNLYSNAKDNHNAQRVNIAQVNTTDPKLIKKIEALRKRVAEGCSKEEKQAKKAELPLVSISCYYNEGTTRETTNIAGFTNYIAIDVDHNDNPTLSVEDMKAIVNATPYVVYSATSVSGMGLFALIELENVNSTDTFTNYFNALQNYFKGYGITIDKACKDATRLRYITHDPNPYINTKALVWWMQSKPYTPKPTTKDTPKRYHQRTTATPNALTDIEKVELIVKDCKANALTIHPTHEDNLTLSASLANAFGEEGRCYYDTLNEIKHPNTCNDSKYSKQYTKDVETPNREATFGSVVELYKHAKGIERVEWSRLKELYKD